MKDELGIDVTPERVKAHQGRYRSDQPPLSDHEHCPCYARLRAALVEIEQYSNSLLGWAAPYGDSVFHKIVRPGQLARKALAE